MSFSIVDMRLTVRQPQPSSDTRISRIKCLQLQEKQYFSRR